MFIVRACGSCGGRNFALLNDNAHRLYNTLLLQDKRVVIKVNHDSYHSSNNRTMTEVST